MSLLTLGYKGTHHQNCPLGAWHDQTDKVGQAHSKKGLFRIGPEGTNEFQLSQMPVLSTSLAQFTPTA